MRYIKHIMVINVIQMPIITCIALGKIKSLTKQVTFYKLSEYY